MEDVERYKKAIEDALVSLGNSGHGTSSLYANLYNALYPKPTYEEVKLEHYALIDEAGNLLATCNEPFKMDELCKGLREVKLTGTFEKVVPKKVKRREEIGDMKMFGMMGISGKTTKIPVGAKLFAEWEE